MKSSRLKNKEMSSDVYVLRRKIINLIHEAKTLVPNLPRINVRVTDNHKHIAGMGRIGGKVIWITENFVANREVVFHEILHAIGIPHIEKSPLMKSSCIIGLPQSICDKEFVKLARKEMNVCQTG